jgi:hypothetical protein
MSTLKREPFHSTHSLGQAIGVSHSTIIRRLLDSLRMKSFICAAIWFDSGSAPSPTRNLRAALLILEGREPNAFRVLVTDDEKQFVLEY